MNLNTEFFEELDLLNLFNLRNEQEGLKIHHEATPGRIAAAQRLYQKNMITLEDGGFLTPLGMEAAELAQSLVAMLRGHAH